MRTLRYGVLLAALAAAIHARADIEITLKNSFIEKFKNRATMTATFTVDKAHVKPNPPKKDGDMHIAGRAPEVGLATVAEIMNAHDVPEAVQRIHDAEGTDDTVKMTGVWRLWCEHGGNVEQVQDKPLKRFTTTNPDHVFEIHPISNLDGKNLLATLQPVEQVGSSTFTPKDAEVAFQRYENLRSRITPGETTTTITTGMAGFNYVEFQLLLNEDPVKITDGRVALAQVQDTRGEILVHNRRMIFVKGSLPETKVASLKAGGCMHVLGIPRINLALVSWRIRHAKQKPEVLDWSLPYEIVIIGFYGDCASEEE
jgi:hypothetical protein